ncbi:hypothetical protein PROFUN_11338 [Planoprotostelium fungivorum]|uniref:Uncharacterized protein n=1 Tax=Planoprotostelium fungivorum TaxID=1890364 RepID=A0A2P6NAC2_9EUKA|nr:hypothetical protein PROFUN_11338 [Planoprotostelium fungivorum]
MNSSQITRTAYSGMGGRLMRRVSKLNEFQAPKDWNVPTTTVAATASFAGAWQMVGRVVKDFQKEAKSKARMQRTTLPSPARRQEIFTREI